MSGLAQPLRFRRRCGPDHVIIVGGGLAGLFTALQLSPLPVTILTPKPLGEGASSAWAQGGIAAAVGEGDSPEVHAADTIAAGDGLAEPEVARLMAREAPRRIEELLRYGVPFDRDLEGKLSLSREAAHSRRRIVRVRGDQAGKAVMATLVAQVSRMSSISVLENVEAWDLLSGDGRITGVRFARCGETQVSELLGRAVVLATGGIGQLYRVTTNPPEARGGGLGMAARAGAAIADAEFVQFHPTAFDIGRDPAPLASEALRGEGAKLVNRDGERFMAGIHPDGELAPRDVVARAVHREIAAGRGAFLDCRAIGLKKHFPGAYAICAEAGLDPDRDLIPIAPAAHYHMGGVLTDVRGRTTLSGLWACGEVASTGVHGANRLASNSLLEAVVFGARVAEDILNESFQWYAMGEVTGEGGRSLSLPLLEADAAIASSLRHGMSAHAGVERSREGLLALLRFISRTRQAPVTPPLDNALTSALLIAVAAFERRESRGAHFRSDFPERAAKAQHSYFTLSQAERIMQAVLGDDPKHYSPRDDGTPFRRVAAG